MVMSATNSLGEFDKPSVVRIPTVRVVGSITSRSGDRPRSQSGRQATGYL